jgi:hypothetical protein
LIPAGTGTPKFADMLVGLQRQEDPLVDSNETVA